MNRLRFSWRVLLAVVIGATWVIPPPSIGARGEEKDPAGKKDKKEEQKEKKKDKEKEKKEDLLRKLVELNGDSIFGGHVKLKGERITLTFAGDGAFEKGFQCSSKSRSGVVSDKRLVKDVAVKKVLIDGAQGKFSFLGLTSGTAVSRFPLEGDYNISFKLRIPTLMRGSKMTWYLNREKKDYIQLNFFRQAALFKKGRLKSRKVSKIPRFRKGADKWFDRKSAGVPVEISFKEDKLTVRMEEKKAGEKKGTMTEVVSLDEIQERNHGRLALSFDKVSFLVTDFKIEGKLPRSWVEQEIESLRKVGKLKMPADKPKAEAKKGKQDGKKDPKKGKEKEGPDLDTPDPEIDEDL